MAEVGHLLKTEESSEVNDEKMDFLWASRNDTYYYKMGYSHRCMKKSGFYGPFYNCSAINLIHLHLAMFPSMLEKHSYRFVEGGVILYPANGWVRFNIHGGGRLQNNNEDWAYHGDGIEVLRWNYNGKWNSLPLFDKYEMMLFFFAYMHT